jgi:hypothetical protein
MDLSWDRRGFRWLRVGDVPVFLPQQKFTVSDRMNGVPDSRDDCAGRDVVPTCTIILLLSNADELQ